MVAERDICQLLPESSSDDPEDGVTGKVVDLLNGRKSKTKIDTWPALWRVLFKDDDKPRSPRKPNPTSSRRTYIHMRGK